MAIRAITTGLYPTNPMAEVVYLLNDSGAKVHFAEDQEQVDKVVEAGPDTFPRSRASSTSSPAGSRTYDDPRLMFWDDFMELGRATGPSIRARSSAHG